MDGGGRLDQPLMRSGLSAAVEVGAPVDEPSRARARIARRRGCVRLPAWLPEWLRAYCRRSGRWAARIVRLPPPRGVGIAASVLLVAGGARLRRSRGPARPRRHRLGQGCARCGREFAWVSHRGDFAVGRERSQPRRDSHHRRRDRTRLALVPRRRRSAHAADGEPLDCRCGRAQALSGPPADHDHRAAGLRAVAEGRPRQRHRRRRHGARTVRGAPLSRPAARGRTRAPSDRPRIFSPSSIATPTFDPCCARRSWWRNGAGICGSPTASTCSCRKRMSSLRSTGWSRSTGTKSSYRATSRWSICDCPIA